jgi:hypothetical protein
VPVAWKGIWEVTTVVVERGGTIVDQVTETNTICAGAPASTEFDFSDSCAGGCLTMTDTAVGYTCSQVVSVRGCTVHVATTASGTVDPSAGTLAVTATVTVDVTPENTECGDDRTLDVTITGIRRSLDTPGCGSASDAGVLGSMTGIARSGR